MMIVQSTHLVVNPVPRLGLLPAILLGLLGCRGPERTSPVKPPADQPATEIGAWPESLDRARDWARKPPEGLPPLIKPSVSKTGDAFVVSYSLGYQLPTMALYPTTASLPQPYQTYYPDPIQTIQVFTAQSLARDGITGAQVSVALVGSGPGAQYVVTITSTNAAVRGYATVHPAFLDAHHGIQSLLGTEACRTCATPCAQCSLCTTPSEPACWDPTPSATQPWAPFLPLGLPLVNQKTVLFLDYPPVPALTGKDYLDNYTMCRWGRVLGASGAADPIAYETIVDSRPIAAPGSGEDPLLPNPTVAYDSAKTGGAYLTPMLQLLTNPLGTLQGGTLPVAVFGTTARETWGQMIGGKTPAVLAVGATHLGNQTLSTSWISTNHPDVTSYNCCSGDTTCNSGGYTSESLLCDEQGDFVASCWMQSMAANPGQAPQAAEDACAARWMPGCANGKPWAQPPQASDALTQCIQEKLDNGNPAAVCCTWQDAWAYCTGNKNVACASLDCKVDPVLRAKAPPSPGETCNHYRFFADDSSDKPYCDRCGCAPPKSASAPRGSRGQKR